MNPDIVCKMVCRNGEDTIMPSYKNISRLCLW